MFLQQLSPNAQKRIAKVNDLLSEQFGINVNDRYPSKQRLYSLLENTQNAILTLRGTNKKFQLDPEYAKFLGIKDVVETMLREGIYAESPAYMEMRSMVESNIRELMDCGYSMEEAINECMNRYRLDSRYAYPDDHVYTIATECANSYVESFKPPEIMPMPTDHSVSLLPEVFEAMARHFNVRPETETAKKIVENKLQQFSIVTNKSRSTVVEFLNRLSKNQLHEGIELFVKKTQRQGKLNETQKAQKAQKTPGHKKLSEKTQGTKILRLISEEFDLDQAEVAVAAKSMSATLQDQVEKLGRMINEDLPAIAEQLRGEMGADVAQSFRDSVEQILTPHLEASKQAQKGIEQAIGTITGEAPATAPSAPAGTAPAPGAEAGGEDLAAAAAATGAEAGAEGGAEAGAETGVGRAEV